MTGSSSAVVSRTKSDSSSGYAIPFRSIENSPEFRLDAGHYNPDLLDAIRLLRESGMRIERLADIVESVFIPPRFRRVYVDAEYGVPFLQGSHVVQFRPTDLKYLSRSIRRLERWQIRQGWILVTCSGTIGRTTICPPEFDGWAASQHILRVIPDTTKCPAGYLTAFLASSLGQVQLAANTYGAVVDEITEEQARSLLVPLPRTAGDRALLRSVDTAMQEMVAKRSESARLVSDAIGHVQFWSAPPRPPLQFSLATAHLSRSADVRLDASHYSPLLLNALECLRTLDTVKLGDVADVFMPPRFKRIYVDAEYGLPFLQGSNVIHFQAEGLKFLANSHEGLDRLRLRTGWILVTRSGSVGRAALCPAEWDGWAASEHIIRVVPADFPSGYLCAFLASPLGQIQLTSQIHGAVVDQLTEEHIRSVLVPLPDTSTLQEIDKAMKSGVQLKSEAVAAALKSVAELEDRFSGGEKRRRS